MVDLVNNSVNNSSVVQKPRVGVIVPPPVTSKVTLYSDAEAKAKFDALNRELSWADRKVVYNDKKKNIKGLLISIATVATAVILIKKGLLNKLKSIKFPSLMNIFKKK